MSTNSVYGFNDAIDFLAFELEKKQRLNPRFSLRSWSRQLGYSTPSYLSQVLKRQRKLKFDLAQKLAANLKLPAQDKKYFEALILFQNCKSVEEKTLYAEVLEDLKPRLQKMPAIYDYERFQVISDWVHLAILEIVNLRDFDGTFDFIDRRLDHNLNRSLLAKAVERLVRLTLLTKENGKLHRVHDLSLLFDQNIPNEGVRAFHEQILDKAKEALLKKSLNDRDFRTSTVTLKKKNFKKIQEILKQAHKEILELSADHDGDDVYQVQTSFFKITKSGDTK